MPTLSHRSQIIIGTLLTLSMLLTRGHHAANLYHLPDASWAVFFLLGFYLKPTWWLPALLALAGFLDYAAITWGGVSSFCVSPAYLFLLPAYSALWLSGRWYARHYRFTWHSLLPLMVSVIGGTAMCELLSSGSFYFFSGRFADTSFSEFATRLVTYFPSNLQSVAIYIGMAAMIHIFFTLMNTKSTADKATGQ